MRKVGPADMYGGVDKYGFFTFYTSENTLTQRFSTFQYSGPNFQ